MLTRQLIFVLVLAALVGPPAHAASPERGRLLYQGFCYHCHISEIHFRVNNRVDSWDELVRIVAMWQAEMGLDWTAGDIEDVAAWLDQRYYHLRDTRGPH